MVPLADNIVKSNGERIFKAVAIATLEICPPVYEGSIDLPIWIRLATVMKHLDHFIPS